MRFKRTVLSLAAALAGSLLLATAANASNTTTTTSATATATSQTTTTATSKSSTTIVYVRVLINGEYKNVPVQVPTKWIENLPAGTHLVNGKIVTIKPTGPKFVPTSAMDLLGVGNIYTNHKNLAVSFGVEVESAFEKFPQSNVTLTNLGNQAALGVTYLVNQKYNVQLYAVSNPDIGDFSGKTGFTGGFQTGQLFAGVSTGSYGNVQFGAQDTAGDYSGLLANQTQVVGGITQMNAFNSAAIVYQSPVIHGFNFVGNYNIGTGSATGASSGNSNGFGLYLADQLTFSKNLVVVNQLGYDRLYKTSMPSTATLAGTQQAWDLGTNWFIGNGVGSAVLGGNYSKVVASQGTGVNINNIGDAYTDYYGGNIDGNDGRQSISAFQIAGAVQYSPNGGEVYANYIGISGNPTSGSTTVGQERAHGAALGINYVFNTSSPTFLEIYAEGAVFKDVNLASTQYNRLFVSGVVLVF